MISFFESSVRISPEALFLKYVREDGARIEYTYWQTRLISASLARRMLASGLSPGDVVTIDLPNSPELVFSLMACTYAGLSVILLDHGLPEASKLSRVMESERSGMRPSLKIDLEFAERILGFVHDLPEDDSQLVNSIFEDVRRTRPVMGEEQDAVDGIVHFAERAAHLFDENAIACILFSGGNLKKNKIAKRKAVALTWANLIGASRMMNDELGAVNGHFKQERLPFNSFSASRPSLSLEQVSPCAWQCVLNLGCIEGLQSLIRSVISRSPLYLYTDNCAEAILDDADDFKNMMIAADDDLLQELLTIEEWRAEVLKEPSSRLANYKCVLLTDNERNPRTLKRAYELGAPIYVSHGCVEASGAVAIKRIDKSYIGGMLPLEGCNLEIIDPDEDGFGKLALQGPGVFSGYLDAQTPFTLDKYFITEERAAIIDGLIYWRNRTENMFVSAGQDIYPVEIADVLRHVQGVSAVHVFGVEDSKCGMLPVAAIERSIPELTPDDIAYKTRQWFSNITVPISIFVFDQLPRMSTGKLDRAAIESIFKG